MARILAGSGVPWTTLRATQFHDLILLAARQLARLPVIPVTPGFRFQPVDAGEVAGRLAELALGTPAGLVPGLAGPKIYDVAGLVRGYLRAAGRHRPIVPLRLPGEAARALRAGVTSLPPGPRASAPGKTSSPPGWAQRAAADRPVPQG